jgi:hypothetical protein
MSNHVLCRERWERIEAVLDKCGGAASLRDLRRSWGIQEWEVEQSAQLGWLDITVQKPRTGRPSRKVAFRDYDYAKWMRSVMQATRRGRRSLFVPPIVSAYIRVYRPRSRAGAYASSSRLCRHPSVRAARQWFYAKLCGEVLPGEEMPETATGIWLRLREVGSWRARLW